MTDTYMSGFEPGPAPFESFTTLYGSKQPIDFEYASIESDAWTAGIPKWGGTAAAFYISGSRELFDHGAPVRFQGRRCRGSQNAN